MLDKDWLVGTGSMTTVAVAMTNESVAGGVNPSSQDVIPLTTIKEYKPEAGDVGVGELAWTALESLV